MTLAACMAFNAAAQEVGLPSDKEISRSIEASNHTFGKVKMWRSEEMGLSFEFDARWKPTVPYRHSIAIEIIWKSPRFNGLLATCHVDAVQSDLGKLTPEEIKRQARKIVDDILQKELERDPDTKLVKWRPALQGGHPGVYIERDTKVSRLDQSFRSRVYSIVSSWRGRQVRLECMSIIPMARPGLADAVEKPIRKVLGSLKFFDKPQ